MALFDHSNTDATGPVAGGNRSIDRILDDAIFALGLPDDELWPAWSTGECLAVAMALDRHDVLKAMGYTIVQALQRIDTDILNALPEISRAALQSRARG